MNKYSKNDSMYKMTEFIQIIALLTELEIKTLIITIAQNQITQKIKCQLRIRRIWYVFFSPI